MTFTQNACTEIYGAENGKATPMGAQVELTGKGRKNRRKSKGQ